MNLPDPLHPAIVHFPIVVILLGTVAAVGAVFWRKHQLPIVAGILLTLGAIGAWVSVETGESDGGLVENASPQAESLLNAHEDWAKRTLTAAAIAAAVAAVSIALFRFPRVARATGAIAAAIAVVASYAVYETGHRGGLLVYKHGAGISVADAGTAAAEPAAPKKDRDDD
jgi:uncharacterized membrane protein